MSQDQNLKMRELYRVVETEGKLPVDLVYASGLHGGAYLQFSHGVTLSFSGEDRLTFHTEALDYPDLPDHIQPPAPLTFPINLSEAHLLLTLIPGAISKAAAYRRAAEAWVEQHRKPKLRVTGYSMSDRADGSVDFMIQGNSSTKQNLFEVLRALGLASQNQK